MSEKIIMPPTPTFACHSHWYPESIPAIFSDLQITNPSFTTRHEAYKSKSGQQHRVGLGCGDSRYRDIIEQRSEIVPPHFDSGNYKNHYC